MVACDRERRDTREASARSGHVGVRPQEFATGRAQPEHEIDRHSNTRLQVHDRVGSVRRRADRAHFGQSEQSAEFAQDSSKLSFFFFLLRLIK